MTLVRVILGVMVGLILAPIVYIALVFLFVLVSGE